MIIVENVGCFFSIERRKLLKNSKTFEDQWKLKVTID
jgi:hypothetical protein